MIKETELSDEQIDGCWDGLMPSGCGKSRYDIARAILEADRELRRGDARVPPLPEPWQGFQFNPGWNTWENVVRGAINEPRVMKAFTAEQMHEYAQAALAAKDVELKGLRPVIVWPEETRVGRREDMSPTGTLEVMFDNDNNVIVAISKGSTAEDWESASVEFCNGGRSLRTRLALIALMVAIEADNAEYPHKDTLAAIAQEKAK